MEKADRELQIGDGRKNLEDLCFSGCVVRLEIDFLIQREGKLLPIEVKAEGNVRSNSLSMLLQSRKELHAERYSMLPYKEQESMTNVPLYAV
ncbi:MAG: DUF4143 domain-containing protein [Bacteroidaceae bacterium]|nr:DUF4143 domain-containing protein [Bacteroidaceae bacterium]